MGSYKLRAEAYVDAVSLGEALQCDAPRPRRCDGFVISAETEPTCKVFFHTMTIDTWLSLDELRQVIAEIEDGHVMAQTVRPIGLYTGERDFDIGLERHLDGRA